MGMDFTSGYRLVSALFLRLLGLVYLIAFISLAVQVEGLAGSNGILSFSNKLAALPQPVELANYLRVPTLFWINSSDAALVGAAWSGAVAALLIALGLWQRVALVAAFVLYLSLYHACLPFLNFQWDGLLLESGFLAIFLTPQSRVVILLFRWLLFRLRFMSGLSKLSMGDPSWSGLTALNYYFEVQPLPTPLAWYAHHLPEWVLRAGTAGTLFVELVVPFMMFLPRRWRFVAAWLTILWQVLIMLTSNHNWINILTIVLCLFLFDDKAVARVVPDWLQSHLKGRSEAAGVRSNPVTRYATALLAVSIVTLSLAHLWELAKMQQVTGPLGTALNYAEAYRVVSKYHVFPTMRTERFELEISGSLDGEEWRQYVFKYKPGDLSKRPPVVLPHQPRLDWQMWFVTLHPMHGYFFRAFMQALLRNAEPVIDLLANNPFPDEAPRYLRVDAYRYHFTDAATRAANGHWWWREYIGPFTPLPWLERSAQAPQHGFPASPTAGESTPPHVPRLYIPPQVE
ncbi:lipase maturation factor [Thiogranum longum]|uniref:Lipase maturation factor n=1 Tax=Thiogranum longum TaxID=1537524 RepID=A0A4R1HD83_9GAMM|nr:lipase maturation factor family protein [Thiogranum longum]TCK18641.1 lipase maturation factor [Thiogranum longum]